MPSEIEKLLVPFPENIVADLRTLDSEMRAGKNADSLLYQQNERVLSRVGLTESERQIIHESWQRIRSRRQRKIHENLESYEAVDEA